MTTIYIAAPWANRATARVVRDELRTLGHEVTSSWLDEAGDAGSVPSDPEAGRAAATTDFLDIDRAALFLVLTDPRPIGAGHHVELGYALAHRKHIVVVGLIKSTFHYLADHIYPDWPTARKAMVDRMAGT